MTKENSPVPCPAEEGEDPEEARLEAELLPEKPAGGPEKVVPLPEGMSPVDLVEALIYSSPEALSTDRLAQASGLSPAAVKEALQALAERLDREERPYRL